MSKMFAEKVALVTGTSSGIGRAIAIAFAKEGARVVLASRSTEGNQETLSLVRAAGGEGIIIATDVTKEADVIAMVKGTVDAFGRLDFAVNNAAISGTPKGIFEFTEAEYYEIVDANLKGVWLCMKHEIPQMLAQRGGAIVNISSLGGLLGAPGLSIYTASKHGVVGLTKCAAIELGTSNVRVNAICPAVIRGTIMVERMAVEHPDLFNRLAAAHPMGRCGQPEEIASAAVWLCSDGASFVTGHALPVDGGTFAGR